MAFNGFVNKKGQIAIEFILLLVVMLVYIQTIVQPVLDTSFNSTDDITRLAQARSAAQKLVNSIDYISLSAGSSIQQIRVYVPEKSTLGCSTPNSVNFSVELNSPGIGTVCDGQDADAGSADDFMKCSKVFKTLNIASLNCNSLGTGGNFSVAQGSGKFITIKLEKSGNIVQVGLQN